MSDAPGCRMHTKSSYAAVAVVALALVACDRDRAEPTSQTTTTSAEMDAVDRSGVAVPMGAVPKSYGLEQLHPAAHDGEADVEQSADGAVHLGEIDAPEAAELGSLSAQPAQPARAPNLNPASRAPTALPDMSGVGPGHIWYAPGVETTKRKQGTGEPNSAGSHNIGAGSTR